MSGLELQSYMEKVFCETKPEILRYITIKCSSTEDIKDILQNTYMCFWLRIKRFGTTFIFNPKQYLLRIAHDETVKYYRATNLKKSVISIDEFGEIPDNSYLFEQVVQNKILSDQIWKEIKKLDQESIKIFTLRFIYDEKLEDIAKELDLSVSTVKNRLYRGLEKLKIIFNKYE